MNKIENLIRDMTLAEKLGQLTMTAAGYAVTGPVIVGDSTEAIKDGTVGNLLNMVGAGPVNEVQRLAVEHSRLGIPLLIGFDVVHGHRTLFPIPLAEAGLFDREAWRETAREAAAEAAADGLAMTFAPMLDVSRDPRWGRTAEGPGEDPWLGSQIATAKVRGFQGEDLSAPHALAAVAKHYCAYGPVTAGRDYASVDISDRTLREVQLPSFGAAVEAGVAAVMPAFTDLAGIPLTAHRELLQGWLRGHWGFDGVIVSDYNAIAELIRHGIAADLSDAAALALKAGVDIDMMANAYRLGLPVALERGRVTMLEIDAAVRRVLTLKHRLGLFDDPYRRGSEPESAATLARRRLLARSVGARSLVLLKNDRGTLPLAAALRRICIIGPLADAAIEMRGSWPAAGVAEGQVSVVAGFCAAFPDADVVHESGVGATGDAVEGIPAALALCEDADAIILCLGEQAEMSGEAACRAYLDLPGRQRTLAEAVFERARQLGKRVIVVLFSGRPLTAPWLFEQADAVLAAWYPGAEAGNAIADVVTGKTSPSGRSAITWPRAVGQIPIFFGERPGGRPDNANDRFTSKYLDVPNSPQFPFGFGLTYGRFSYANLRLSKHRVRKHESLDVQVDVSNLGARAAEETAFLFTRDRLASVSRPLLELKGFGKIRLEPGQTGTLTLQLAAADLKFLGQDLTPVYEPGEVEVLVGPWAERDKLLAASVQLI